MITSFPTSSSSSIVAIAIIIIVVAIVIILVLTLYNCLRVLRSLLIDITTRRLLLL